MDERTLSVLGGLLFVAFGAHVLYEGPTTLSSDIVGETDPWCVRLREPAAGPAAAAQLPCCQTSAHCPCGHFSRTGEAQELGPRAGPARGRFCLMQQLPPWEGTMLDMCPVT